MVYFFANHFGWSDGVVALITLLVEAGVLTAVLVGVRAWVSSEWEHRQKKRFADYEQTLKTNLESQKAELGKELEALRSDLALTRSVFETRYSLYHAARFEVARKMSQLVAEVEARVTAYTEPNKVGFEGEEAEGLEEAEARAAWEAVKELATELRRERVLLDDGTAKLLEELRDAAFRAIWLRGQGSKRLKDAEEMRERVLERKLAGVWVDPNEEQLPGDIRQMGVDAREEASAVSGRARDVQEALLRDLRKVIEVAEPGVVGLEAAD